MTLKTEINYEIKEKYQKKIMNDSNENSITLITIKKTNIYYHKSDYLLFEWSIDCKPNRIHFKETINSLKFLII